jgi:hypothetical protein
MLGLHKLHLGARKYERVRAKKGMRVRAKKGHVGVEISAFPYHIFARAPGRALSILRACEVWRYQFFAREA